MKESQCIIDIAEPAQTWARRVNTELGNLPATRSNESARWKKRSIYKLPPNMIDLFPKAYMPHTVSIGPYHRGDNRLEAMEGHKHRALLNFLKRSPHPLQSYINALARASEDLQDAYDSLDINDTEAFLEVMMVDGCFLLELMRTTTGKSKDHLKEYEENDPVFSKHGKLYIVPYLERDMFMLENQLPMQVLTTLLAVESGAVEPTEEHEKQAVSLILEFFSGPSEISDTKCFHMLDVLRKSLLVTNPKTSKNSGRRAPLSVHPQNTKKTDEKADPQNPQKTHRLSSPLQKLKSKAKNGRHRDEIIRSATELVEAGINIKASRSKSLTDISFRRGVLRLPPIIVDDALETQYLNLMAFERFHVGAGNEVTSYVFMFIMDSIIDSARDVSILHSSGVIQSALGSDKAVAHLFNTISKDITLDPDSSLDKVHKKVSRYCRKLRPRATASLKHNYFTNPWAIVSVLAAAVLFVLTGVQTVYSVLSYYKPDSCSC